MVNQSGTGASSASDLKNLFAEVLREIAKEPKANPLLSPEARLALKEFNETAVRLKTWAA